MSMCSEILAVSMKAINSIENSRFNPCLTLAINISNLLEKSVEETVVIHDDKAA